MAFTTITKLVAVGPWVLHGKELEAELELGAHLEKHVEQLALLFGVGLIDLQGVGFGPARSLDVEQLRKFLAHGGGQLLPSPGTAAAAATPHRGGGGGAGLSQVERGSCCQRCWQYISNHYICPALIDPPQCCDLPTDRL